MKPLIDSLGRRHTYLRLSVTDRCNAGCVYCKPATEAEHRPRAEILTFDEIARIVRLCASLGVSKVRLTGGEPLVRRDIEELVRMLAGIEGLAALAMTTNGILLERHARSLKDAGLTALTVSLDTLRPDRYERIARCDGYGAARAGIAAAIEAGFAPLKINVVVMGGVNDDELLDFVELARESPFIVRFIEYMPFAFNCWAEGRYVPYDAMRARIEGRYALVPVPETDADPGVAKEFTIEGFAGRIGFITPLSHRFCSACSRLRLTAGGALKPCLFAPAIVNLREALREGASDGDIARLLDRVLASKAAAAPPREALAFCQAQPMYEIGG